MKNSVLIFLLCTITAFVFAQKQANIWYFGNRVGLDFNQLPPRPLYNSNLNSVEGTSSIADNNGKLLFYTNGLSIMNRKHTLMMNGGGLAGHPSSTNNTVIVPLPGNDSIYYVFTTGAANEALQQFQYNIVNIKGDGGYGEVIPGGNNALVEDKVFEKIAAVKHCNKRDTWIVIHKWDSDEYHAYLLTASGLSNTPVISHTGLVINGLEINELGTLKFSADGSKFVSVHPLDNDGVELMDFDNTTGVLSNPVFFRANPVPLTIGAYGAEFSPDGRLLYVTSNDYENQEATLFQFDITTHNQAAIEASKLMIHKNHNYLMGNLQTGPDQKIYLAMFNDTSVSVIEDPNTTGPACNFVYNKIYLGYNNNNTPVQYGLPTFVQSLFNPASNPYDFVRLPGKCTDRNVTFTISRLGGIDSVKWFFGDGNQSQALQPTNNYVTPGFYDVKLIVYKIDCSGMNDTIIRKIWIADTDRFLGNDTSSCNTIKLDIGIDEIYAVNYLWNTGSIESKITTSGFGDYWLELEQNGCTLRDTIKVTEKPKPVVSLGPDTTVCKYRSVILRTLASNYDSYLWSTGETTPSVLVDKTGTYFVKVTQQSCEASDTIKVFPGECDIYLPSAFSPNNDNLNETFGVVDYSAVQYFSLQVYNKWGQLVFTTKDINQKWDGTFKGKKVPNGSYLWMLNYTNLRGRKFYDQGTLMLIR